MILVRNRAGAQKHAEDVRAVALEERSRLAAVRRPRDERLDDLRIDVDRQRRENLLAGRIDEVEPACAHSARG